MKKIVLLGDSIRLIGYGKAVPGMMGEGYEVFQPTDNCRYAKYTLRCIFREWADMLADSDVIHWNNGLWDAINYGDGWFTDAEEYVKNILRIAENLKKHAKTVIFATTTPVVHDDARNAVIKEYNALVVSELQKRDIVINDLHSLVDSDREKYICEDGVHLSEAGIKECGEQVAKIIKEYV